MQAILAAEVGYRDLAYDYFEHALNVDLLNLHGNAADGVHVASTGGVWAALVYGFAGLRDDTGEWLFDPRLPEDWDGPGVQPAQQRLLGALPPRAADAFTAALRAGEDEVGFSVRGVPYMRVPGAARGVAWSCDGQGPVLEGEPAIEAVFALQRDDGSPLTSSIKKLTHEEELANEPPITIIG